MCEVSTPAHSGASCIFDLIGCGSSVRATTEGGSVALDAEFYESAYCFIPEPDDYGAAERVYELVLDGGGEPITATITLDAPCGELSLAAFYWPEGDSCPQGSAHSVSVCEGKPASDGSSVLLYATGEDPARYLVAVDGQAEAAFELSVSCEGG